MSRDEQAAAEDRTAATAGGAAPREPSIDGRCMDASYVLDWLKQIDAPENIVALQEKVVEDAGGYISGADRVRPW